MLLRRAPREVYRVYSASEYLAGADLLRAREPGPAVTRLAPTRSTIEPGSAGIAVVAAALAVACTLAYLVLAALDGARTTVRTADAAHPAQRLRQLAETRPRRIPERAAPRPGGAALPKSERRPEAAHQHRVSRPPAVAAATARLRPRYLAPARAASGGSATSAAAPAPTQPSVPAPTVTVPAPTVTAPAPTVTARAPEPATSAMAAEAESGSSAGGAPAGLSREFGFER